MPYSELARMRREEKEIKIRARLHGSFYFRQDAHLWPHDALCRCEVAWHRLCACTAWPLLII